MAAEKSAPQAWAAVARLDAKPTPPFDLLASAGSKAGLSTVVLDTGLLINSNVVYTLPGVADQFVTVPEVLKEIRDSAARAQLATLPFKLHTVEPSQDALTKVAQFARATGDLQSLSTVDLRLLALTYTLEVQAHGSSHLRTTPPPLKVVPAARLRVKDPPGWGNNVSNPEEWEEIDKVADDRGRSRILGVQDLSLWEDGEVGASAAVVDAATVRALDSGLAMESLGEEKLDERQDDGPEVSESGNAVREGAAELHQSGDVDGKILESRGQSSTAALDLEGKRNVWPGRDANTGEDDSGGWQKACSRSTRRKHLRRAAKAAARDQALSQSGAQGASAADESEKPSNGTTFFESAVVNDYEEGDEDLPEMIDLEEEEDSEIRPGDAVRQVVRQGADASSGGTTDQVLDEEEKANGRQLLDSQVLGFEPRIQDGTASNLGDDNDSVQTVTEESHFRSSIACMTADFAIQNVLLQMGLRLLSAGGLQVRELHRWVLKCQACSHVTPATGRLFCPKCGNGGTLHKTSVTLGEDGMLLSGKPRRVNIRGTRFSLPLPKGGREGALQNPVLCEDQLPQRLMKPKVKKVSLSEGLESCNSDDLFSKSSKSNIRQVPSLRNTFAILSGRRNPNERRVTRRH